MNLSNISSMFSRLSIGINSTARNISMGTNILYFRVTDTLLGEPLRKKKRLDVNIIKNREMKRKRKLEKEIRKLEKHSKQLKPCKDLEVPPSLEKEKNQRLRSSSQLTEAEIDTNVSLEKEWAKYKGKQFIQDQKIISNMFYSQERALIELRLVSEELYIQAIQKDKSLKSYKATGPTHTPPIKHYYAPDGEYKDITKKYQGEE